MNESREFMAGFMAARFLPHTDRTLFPSVAAKMGGARSSPSPRRDA
jgi:hypothetical protein